MHFPKVTRKCHFGYFGVRSHFWTTWCSITRMVCVQALDWIDWIHALRVLHSRFSNLSPQLNLILAGEFWAVHVWRKNRSRFNSFWTRQEIYATHLGQGSCALRRVFSICPKVGALRSAFVGGILPWTWQGSIGIGLADTWRLTRPDLTGDLWTQYTTMTWKQARQEILQVLASWRTNWLVHNFRQVWFQREYSNIHPVQKQRSSLDFFDVCPFCPLETRVIAIVSPLNNAGTIPISHQASVSVWESARPTNPAWRGV